MTEATRPEDIRHLVETVERCRHAWLNGNHNPAFAKQLVWAQDALRLLSRCIRCGTLVVTEQDHCLIHGGDAL
jgi:hypothetical protein